MKIEKISTTVSSAIDEVLNEYNLTFNDIEYEVIQEPSKGFLGFGKKLAKVSFTIKKDLDLQKQVNEIDTDYNSTKQPSLNEFSNKSFNENAPQIARDFLTNMFDIMNSDINIKIDFIENKDLIINLEGENIGFIIGKRGQTLYSLQYLLNLIINKGEYSYVNVKLDIFEYSKKRKETLENLANKLTQKVRNTKKTVKLEPMNSYERKIIHNFLKNYDDIKSFSKGKEPYRYIVIAPKNN